MCSLLAPRVALGFDAIAAAGARPSFLDRRRGVAAVATVARGVMARGPEPARRAGAHASPAPPTRKRGRQGFAVREVPAVVPAAAQPQKVLQERMKVELDAVRYLLNKAKLLSRAAGRSGGAAPAAKDGFAAGPRPEAPPMQAPEKRRKTTSPSKPTSESAHLPVTPPLKQQQQQRRRPAEPSTPSPPQCSLEERIEKAKARLKMRRLEAIARAREKCRQEVLEMEKAVIPDETISPRDLEELGIAFPYAVTRTRRQAQCCQTSSSTSQTMAIELVAVGL